MSTHAPSRHTPASASTTTTTGCRAPALRPVGHERFRSHTAVAGSRSRLSDAVATFDELVVTARNRAITDRPEVRAAFGAAVDAVARAIRRLPHTEQPAGEIGWVLVDRAAARFTSRVIGTDLGRRPCPPQVMSALDDVREVVSAWS